MAQIQAAGPLPVSSGSQTDTLSWDGWTWPIERLLNVIGPSGTFNFVTYPFTQSNTCAATSPGSDREIVLHLNTPDVVRSIKLYTADNYESNLYGNSVQVGYEDSTGVTIY